MKSSLDGRLRSGLVKCLTGNAGDAQHVGVAHIELVHQRARLVGVYDDHLAGRVGAGEDPHPAAHGVRLLELLGLDGGSRLIQSADQLIQ